jgi:hypothetical protein
MEPVSLLWSSQEPATDPYPGPDEWITATPTKWRMHTVTFLQWKEYLNVYIILS